MPMEMKKNIVVACPHGFCAGVDRAIRMMELTLEKYGAPIYCLNEIVHNSIVVKDFSLKGVRFVKSLAEIPSGSVVLFSAHGVAPSVRAEAGERTLRVVDATCPFVEKIHREVRNWAAAGKRIFLVGHKGHEEIVGIAGEAPESVTIIESEADARTVDVDSGAGVAVATQTTLSGEEAERVIGILEERYPELLRPSRGDICYATLNRQRAVKAMAGKVDLMLVIGARNSSNTNRLVEVALSVGLRAELVDALPAVDKLNLEGVSAVGVTAGASTPESFTESVVKLLNAKGYLAVERFEVVEEECSLKLPEI